MHLMTIKHGCKGNRVNYCKIPIYLYDIPSQNLILGRGKISLINCPRNLRCTRRPLSSGLISLPLRCTTIVLLKPDYSVVVYGILCLPYACS